MYGTIIFVFINSLKYNTIGLCIWFVFLLVIYNKYIWTGPVLVAAPSKA